MRDHLWASRFHFATLFFIGVAIFLSNLGGRDLWEPDETRYAVVAREMRESGNWILPHLNGRIYADKPPLFFWLVNLSVFFLGEDSELANRLPSALAGLLAILLTFFFGVKLFNFRVGFISGFILATCFFFPQISRWMMLDSLFTLLFLLTLYCFYCGFEKEEGRRKCFLFAGLFMGLGVLTKGPVAFLTLPIVLIFNLLQQEGKKFWNQDLLFGFLLSLAIVFIWLIPACWLGGEAYRDKILFGQTLGRLIEGGRHFHAKPFFFYFIRFPLEFFPWIVFLPAVFFFTLKDVKSRSEIFLLVWFITVFLFFTLSKGKKDNYILPLYPAAAMLVGVLWDSELDSNKRSKELLAGLISLTSLFLMIFVLALLGIPNRSYPVIEPYRLLVLGIISYLLTGSLLSTLFFMKRRRWASFICLVMTFTFFHLHLSYAFPHKMNELRSMRPFSERILKRMEKEDELKVVFFSPTGLYYYTRRPFTEEIWSQDRLIKVFQSSDRVFWVVQKGDLDQLKKDLRVEISPIDQAKVGHWDMVLISNR